MPSAHLPPARLPLGDLILLRQARVREEDICEECKQCGIVFGIAFGVTTTATAAIAFGVTTTSSSTFTGCTLAHVSDCGGVIVFGFVRATTTAVAFGASTTAFVFWLLPTTGGVEVQGTASDESTTATAT